MRRVTKMALGIGIPVAVVLITAVLLISFSIKTVGSGEICVLLNKNNEPVNNNTYQKGVHFIGLINHLSPSLPDEGGSVLGVITHQGATKPEGEQSEGDEVITYVFYKYYVGKNNTHRFFREHGYNMTAMQIPNVFTKEMQPLVADIVLNITKTAIDTITDQDTWCEYFANETIKLLKNYTFPFELDSKSPVRAVFFDDR